MNPELALFSGEPSVTEPWPEWPILGQDERVAIEKLLKKNSLSVLRKDGIIAEFEDAFSNYFGTKHALSFSSGTASLHAACFACGVGPGWEVLTPSYTWMSAITAILHGNGTPVFCDVQKDSFHIDPKEILKKATSRTKAVIVGHIWGIPAPMDDIMAAAQQKELKVIEDASHCHGGLYKGKLLGTIGDIGCFSLQASKALAAGEGGTLVTNESLLYERAMVPGHHDLRLKECLTRPELKGFQDSGGYWKYRAAPLEMAIACEQLKKLKERNSVKLANFERLEAKIKDIPFLKFPKLPPDSQRGFYGSPCLYTYDQDLVSRDTFLQALAAEGATVFPGYDVNWYQVPLFQEMELFQQLWVGCHSNGTQFQPLKKGSLPNTDRIVEQTIVIPSWGKPVPTLVDQYAVALTKVCGQMERLAEYQRNRQNTK